MRYRIKQGKLTRGLETQLLGRLLTATNGDRLALEGSD